MNLTAKLFRTRSDDQSNKSASFRPVGSLSRYSFSSKHKNSSKEKLDHQQQKKLTRKTQSFQTQQELDQKTQNQFPHHLNWNKSLHKHETISEVTERTQPHRRRSHYLSDTLQDSYQNCDLQNIKHFNIKTRSRRDSSREDNARDDLKSFHQSCTTSNVPCKTPSSALSLPIYKFLVRNQTVRKKKSLDNNKTFARSHTVMNDRQVTLNNLNHNNSLLSRQDKNLLSEIYSMKNISQENSQLPKNLTKLNKKELLELHNEKLQNQPMSLNQEIKLREREKEKEKLKLSDQQWRESQASFNSLGRPIDSALELDNLNDTLSIVTTEQTHSVNLPDQTELKDNQSCISDTASEYFLKPSETNLKMNHTLETVLDCQLGECESMHQSLKDLNFNKNTSDNEEASVPVSSSQRSRAQVKHTVSTENSSNMTGSSGARSPNLSSIFRRQRSYKSQRTPMTQKSSRSTGNLLSKIELSKSQSTNDSNLRSRYHQNARRPTFKKNLTNTTLILGSSLKYT